jgi:hypothetical protein
MVYVEDERGDGKFCDVWKCLECGDEEPVDTRAPL